MLCRLALLACLAAPAAGQTLEVESSDGTICSAFTVRPGIVATAAHCASGGVYKLPGGSARLVARGDFEAPGMTESEQTAADVALLATAVPLPGPARLARRTARLGEVLEMAPPGGGYRSCAVAGRNGDSYDLYCDVREGWSGAPVFARGLFGGRIVIGMISGRVGDPGDGVAIMVHASAIRRLIESIR